MASLTGAPPATAPVTSQWSTREESEVLEEAVDLVGLVGMGEVKALSDVDLLVAQMIALGRVFHPRGDDAQVQ